MVRRSNRERKEVRDLAEDGAEVLHRGSWVRNALLVSRSLSCNWEQWPHLSYGEELPSPDICLVVEPRCKMNDALELWGAGR